MPLLLTLPNIAHIPLTSTLLESRKCGFKLFKDMGAGARDSPQCELDQLQLHITRCPNDFVSHWDRERKKGWPSRNVKEEPITPWSAL